MRALQTSALLSCLALCSCLEMEQKVTIKPDGSGTQALKMTLRDSLITELRRRQPAAQLGSGSDPTAVFDEEKVRGELSTAGMSLSSHRVVRERGLRTVDMVASFASFGDLQQSPLCGSAAEWELGAGPKPGLAKLTLYPQGKEAWQQARARVKTMQREADPVAAQYFRKRQAQLRGLDMELRFELPGDVLVWTKNMKKVAAREVVARVEAEQIKTPADLIRRLAPRFEVIFDARGTTLLTDPKVSNAPAAPGR